MVQLRLTKTLTPLISQKQPADFMWLAALQNLQEMQMLDFDRTPNSKSNRTFLNHLPYTTQMCFSIIIVVFWN